MNEQKLSSVGSHRDWIVLEAHDDAIILVPMNIPGHPW